MQKMKAERQYAYEDNIRKYEDTLASDIKSAPPILLRKLLETWTKNPEHVR